jgi:hypothetical protein
MLDLENRIVATQATTRADLAAKRRFIQKTGFITDPYKRCETGCLYGLVDMILELDAERVAAGKASRKNSADVVEAAAIVG